MKTSIQKKKEKTNPIPPLLFPSKRRTQAPQILYIYKTPNKAQFAERN